MNGVRLSASAQGIGIKDKLGYALGDMGIQMTTALISSFLQLFYTDVLFIPLNQILVLFMAARVWDAVNDPLWGVFVDSRKPSKYGKFRQYMIWFLLPHTAAAILLFTRFAGLSENQYLIYAYITYIAYGMIDTGIGIPYGSLASVITDNEEERTALSTFRSIGSGLGGLPAMILLAPFVFTKNAAGEDVLDANALVVAVTVLSLISAALFISSFRMVKERVAYPEKKQKQSVLKTILTLLRNRPFIAVCLVAMLQISVTYFQNTTNQYLFKAYFEQPKLYSFVSIATYAPMVLLIPFIGKLVRVFGKKELCTAGLLFSALCYFVLLVIRTTNPYVYLVFSFLGGLGITFLSLQVWALATDTIDYHELLSGRREEGTSYAFFSFTRKLGHTVAGVASTGLLAQIGYEVSEKVVVQSAEVTRGIYTVATGAPAVLYLLAFLLLAFVYNLGKKELPLMHEKLDTLRKERDRLAEIEE